MTIEFFGDISIPDYSADGAGIDEVFLARHSLSDDYCALLKAVLATSPAAQRPSIRFFADSPIPRGKEDSPPLAWLLGFGKAADGWTPKDAYPDIIDKDGLLAAALRLSEVELWYSSVDFQGAEWMAAEHTPEDAEKVRKWAQTIAPHWPHDLGLMRAGVNFTAKAALLSDLDTDIRAQLGLTDPVAVSGAVGLDEDGVFLELGGAIKDATWPLLDGKLTVTVTGLRMRISGLDNPDLPVFPGITLLGRITVGKKHVKVTLTLSPGATTVGLLAEVEQHTDSGSWLESLVPDLADHLSPFAAEVQRYTPGLQQMNARLPLRGGGRAWASLSFGYETDLSFFDDLVRLRPVITVSTNFTKGGTSAELSGYWIVGTDEDEARFDVSVKLPGGDVFLTLANGYRLRLADKLEALLAPARKGQSDLEVVNLDLEGNIRTGTFELTIQTFGAFVFEVGGTPIRLGEIMFSVEGEKGAGWQAHFEAILTIGGYELDLSAEIGETMEFMVLMPSVAITDLSADLFKVPPPAELAEARIEQCLMSLHIGAETRFEFSARSNAAITVGGVTIHVKSLQAIYDKAKKKPLTLDGAAQIVFGKTEIDLNLSYADGTWRLGGSTRTDFDLTGVIDAIGQAMGFETPFAEGGVVVKSFVIDLSFGDAGTRMGIRCGFEIDGSRYHLLLIAGKPPANPEKAEQPGWTHFLEIGAPPLDFFNLPLIGAPLKSFAETTRQAMGARDGTNEARLDNLTFRLASSVEPKRLDALFSGLDIKDFPPPGALGGRASLHTDITLLDYKKALDYPSPPKAADKPGKSGVAAGEADPKGAADKPAERATQKPPAPAGEKAATPAAPPAAPPSFAPPSGKDRGWWLPLDRSLGPVTIDRVGVATDIASVSFLIDASANFGPIKLKLLALEAKSKIRLPIAPEFSLKGVIVGCTTDALTISGGLLKMAENSYAGSVMIGFGKVNLTAIGAYTEIPDGATGGTVPSVALFAVLGAPLGGPPAFFVTGLAGGIGYNRSWAKVPLEAVSTHPMVVAAEKGSADNSAISLLDEISPPRKGDHWVAVGVKFTSFKIINGVGILVLALGDETRVGLLAKLDLTFPPKVPGADLPTLIHAEILLQAEYRPAAGELKVDGMLAPKSFLLDEKAEISGGFALYCWFDPSPHAGDFVLTLGGYHPRFKPPAHYPKVERLAFNWRPSDNVSIKGRQYFALTPAAVMAGGSLEIDYQGGWGRASFKAEANFIIYFQPFAYSAQVGVAVHIEAEIDVWPLTLRLSFDLSVSLEIWGPPFGALARVSFYGLTKDIAIGNQARPASVAVTWAEFRGTFLPLANASERTQGKPTVGAAPTATDSLLTITASSGLVAKLDPASGRQRRALAVQDKTNKAGEADDWLIDPGAFKLVIGTSIPSKRLKLGKIERVGNAGFGIGPMGLLPEQLNVTLSVAFAGAAGADWIFQETKSSVAAGLWHPPGSDLPTSSTISDVLTGAQLELQVRRPTGCTPTRSSIPAGTPRRAWWVTRSRPKTARDADMAEMRETIAGPAVTARRTALIRALEAVNTDIAVRLAARESEGGVRMQPLPPILRQANGLEDVAEASHALFVDAPQLSRWENM